MKATDQKRSRPSSRQVKAARLESEHALAVASSVATANAILEQGAGGEIAAIPEVLPVVLPDKRKLALAKDQVEVAGAEPSKTSTETAPFKPSRNGVLESPLARRMREEAEQRDSRSATSSGQAGRTRRRFAGPEYEAVDAKVRSLTSELQALRNQALPDGELVHKISETRRQLKELRGAPIEGIQPFDEAVAEARKALVHARKMKSDFLASPGLAGANLRPSLRRQLRELRSQQRVLWEAAGGESAIELEKALKQAKSERRAVRKAPVSSTDETQGQVPSEPDSAALATGMPVQIDGETSSTSSAVVVDQGQTALDQMVSDQMAPQDNVHGDGEKR